MIRSPPAVRTTYHRQTNHHQVSERWPQNVRTQGSSITAGLCLVRSESAELAQLLEGNEDRRVGQRAARLNGSRHTRLVALALVFVIIWPIGMPALYAVLLAGSRHAIKGRKPSLLSRACSFLHAEYKPAVRTRGYELRGDRHSCGSLMSAAS